jgi:hypothetical protein
VEAGLVGAVLVLPDGVHDVLRTMLSHRPQRRDDIAVSVGALLASKLLAKSAGSTPTTRKTSARKAAAANHGRSWSP